MADADLTLTIKYGKGYEDSWIVLRGATPNELRALAIEYFGVDGNQYEGLSLHEVTVNLTNIAHGNTAVATNLGGTVVPTNGTGEAPQEDAQPTVRGSAAFDAAGDSDADPYQPIADLFMDAESIPALKKLYAKHKSAYEASEAVRDAYKARGKELKAKDK